MLDLLTDLMGVVPAACDYAEARHVDRLNEMVAVRNGAIDRVESDEGAGLGVRVRIEGGWGFAATDDLSAAGARRALGRAIAVAEAQPRGASPWAAALAPEPPARGHWASPCTHDPFAVSVDDKLAHLLAADAAMAGDARVVRREASCQSSRTRWAFASTDGAACTQEVTTCGGGLSALAADGEEAQVRSYPSNHGGSVAQAGWEQVLALELAAHAPRVAAEAVELLTAPPCPEGERTLVIGAEQLALQVHESIGHALELDRILGGEASYAGTSWVAAGDVGRLRYGSERLAVTADATLPGALGSFGWDDEGVAAQRTPLIRDGVLRATLSDRTSAAAVGLPRSGGCARADGYTRQPIVRMTNVSIEPGDAGTLEDLIADTDDGLYVETNRSWSIDDRRLHFQFGTEIAREIRGGTLGRLVRNASYAGVTPRFWSALDAVCSREAWEVQGLLNCGKGEPGQMMAVSHGVAPARFRGVQVGIG
ncbi:MAG: TldD/PmbA family protein [Actinobacteria bacterium]|nr:MAG: TldD/PmbA family protein [Actinomycetota bacterium]